MARRRCSECDASLDGKPAVAKTCSRSCREKRSRRIKRETRARQLKGRQTFHPPHHEELSQAERKDVASQVLKEELRPAAREAITADVLEAIATMVRLTPKAVEAIAKDLESTDDNVRQKAYGLIMRYTLGNQSVAPPPTDAVPGGLTVQFNVPRPDAAALGTESILSGDVDEGTVVKQCQECHLTKPEDQFVAGSQRCEDCHNALQAEVLKRFA